MRAACLLVAALLTPGLLVAQNTGVQMLPPALNGSRPLEKQTESAVVRDYLASWQSLRMALDQNQAALLDVDFVGTARTKLAETIAEQAAAGIHARYLNPSHQLQFVFYSPEGSSIEMVDTVSYVEELREGDQLLATQPITARYLVVMTPAEVRWKVRVFQAEAP